MIDTTYLLSDKQMRDFIVNGYVIVKTDLARNFHDEIYKATNTVFEKEGNPGNNLLPRIPEIQRVFEDQTVRGALTSLLGADYYMQPHRHPHINPPKSKRQNLHQDGGKRWSHRTRRLLVFYYPQDTPEELGPTSIVPGSHYYCTPEGGKIRGEVPLSGESGTVTIANYDLWHRAMPNRTDMPRYMMKFLSARMSEPDSPSWNTDQPDWMSGTPIGNPEHQTLFKHVWDWHHGKTTSNTEANGVPGDATISRLIATLYDGGESVCLRAAYQLAAFGVLAIPDLVALLEEESEVVRRNVCYALSAIGAPAVAPLIHALEAKNWWTRDSAAEVLGDMGLDAQEAVPALMRAVRDESDAVRSHAAEALGTTGQLSASAVPALITALQDAEESVRRNAVFALAQLGPHARDAVRALQNVLFDKNRYVRGDAAHALHRIGTKEASDVLLHYLTMFRWCPLTTRESTH